MIVRIFVFLILNYAALGLGSFFTGSGVVSNWYLHLHKAPWTPPGWVFGAAWSGIMILFSIYLARWWSLAESKKVLIIIYAIQWILNVMWNPIFFYFQQIQLSLFTIIVLTLWVSFIIFRNKKLLGVWTIFLLPYLIWLGIASSLNLYIVAYN